MSTPTTTRAIAATAPGPVDADTSFVEVDLDLPAPGPHDLLVEVRAVSVNPADAKVLASFDEGPKVLGFDAAGVVTAIGPEVTAFAVGDEVYYAGSVARPGSNAELQLVDERIVGHKPTTLTFAEAAALPLTTITAWETLFERMGLTAESTGTLLVVGGAGGVGSMVVQLARKLTGVTVIATASRPESREWALALGAHRVVDHRKLRDEVSGVNWVFSPFSEGNVETFAEIMAVHGHVVAIDEPEGLDTLPLKSKSQTWTWELMFTRPLFDQESTAQRDLLDTTARLVDAGVLRTTMTKKLTPITAETLRAANAAVEGSAMVGKIVVAAE